MALKIKIGVHLQEIYMEGIIVELESAQIVLESTTGRPLMQGQDIQTIIEFLRTPDNQQDKDHLLIASAPIIDLPQTDSEAIRDLLQQPDQQIKQDHLPIVTGMSKAQVTDKQIVFLQIGLEMFKVLDMADLHSKDLLRIELA